MGLTGVGNYIALRVMEPSVGEVRQEVPDLELVFGDVVAYNSAGVAFTLSEDDVRFVFVKAEDIYGKFDE